MSKEPENMSKEDRGAYERGLQPTVQLVYRYRLCSGSVAQRGGGRRNSRAKIRAIGKAEVLRGILAYKARRQRRNFVYALCAPAYVSIRQHASACVSMRQHADAC